MNKVMQIFKIFNNFNKKFARTAVDSVSKEVPTDKGIKPWHEIPGPPSLPIIGQFYHFLPGGSLHVLETYPEVAYKKYGPIVRLDAMFGRPPYALIFDPESAAQVYRGENLTPTRTGFYSLKYYREVYGRKKGEPDKPTGLITDQGEKWKKARSTINPVMLPPKTVKRHTKILDEIALDMVEHLKRIRNKDNKIKGEFDIHMNMWALECVGALAFGGRLNCFDPDLPENSLMRRMIHCVHETLALSNELDFKPNVWRYISTPTFRNAMKVYAEHERHSKYFVERAKEKLKSPNQNPDEERGMVEKLLEVDENIAAVTASDMLLAGIDTVAHSVISTLYYLASNPDKQHKLREESIAGDQKVYLKACIKESLRLRSIAFANLRLTTREYNLMSYRIPKNVYVVAFHNHMCLMENQFPRPHEYIPERWIEKGPLSHRNAHPFAYSPFGFGTRNCIGNYY
uniref:Cytochrome P450 n=2 Tax=Pectinophora gossypiella TaxID=13191 RepID=A0A1E1WAC2_PECGO